MLQVLLVDDDPCQLRIREMILRNVGLVVHLANDADSALAVLHSMCEKIGVVVTDHYLRGRSGAELVRELRLASPSMPVVVLSGMPGIESEYEGMNVAFHLKPYSPTEFIREIQGVLDNHSK